MSKGKSKKLCFVGYHLDRAEMNWALSLIEMTTGRFGLHKRYFKTEETFWTAIEHITGSRRQPDERFQSALFRVWQSIHWMPRDKKAEMVGAVDRRSFFEVSGVKLSDVFELENTIQLPRSETVRKLRAPRPIRDPARKVGKAPSPSVAAKDEFYRTWGWRTLRLEVIKEHGRACQCCGATPGMMDAAGDPVRICVDHIKPISKYWHLRLVRSNLQILCDECNMGKGNWDETDFRPPAAPDEWVVSEDQDDIALTVLKELNEGTVQ